MGIGNTRMAIILMGLQAKCRAELIIITFRYRMNPKKWGLSNVKR